VLFFLCGIATAEDTSYTIRVARNSNLRNATSLDSDVLASARANSTLQVVGRRGRWLRVQRDGKRYWMAGWVRHIRVNAESATAAAGEFDNCCFVDRQCHSEQEWNDGYWAYRRGQCPGAAAAAPVNAQRPPASSVPTNTDNCCFVDRQCHSEQEWNDGYWAYQRGQCSGGVQTASQPASKPGGDQTDNCCFIGWQCHSDIDWQRGYSAYQDNQCNNAERQAQLTVVVPEGVDNCCYVNRQCDSEAEWAGGWQAFHHFQCNVPSASQGISIQGSPEFAAQMHAALALLRDRAPQWWKYSTRGLDTIKMVPDGSVSGVYVATKTYQETLSEALREGKGEAGLVYVIFGIVHEACHVNEGHRYHQAVEEEKACMQASLHALRAINPTEGGDTIEWIRWIIANIYKPDVQWW